MEIISQICLDRHPEVFNLKNKAKLILSSSKSKNATGLVRALLSRRLLHSWSNIDPIGSRRHQTAIRSSIEMLREFFAEVVLSGRSIIDQEVLYPCWSSSNSSLTFADERCAFSFRERNSFSSVKAYCENYSRILNELQNNSGRPSPISPSNRPHRLSSSRYSRILFVHYRLKHTTIGSGRWVSFSRRWTALLSIHADRRQNSNETRWN